MEWFENDHAPLEAMANNVELRGVIRQHPRTGEATSTVELRWGYRRPAKGAAQEWTPWLSLEPALLARILASLQDQLAGTQGGTGPVQ